MATRFRLPSAGTADVSPAFQSYSHTQSTRFPLPTSDSSALATNAFTPDAADHLVAGDAVHYQFVSAPMNSGITFTSGDAVQLVMQCLEAHTNNNLFLQLFVSIVSEDGSTVRRALVSKTADGVELATALTNRNLTTTQSGANYTTVAGDRLVVEISVTGTPAAAGGTQGHNASLRVGSNGAGGDLAANDTETGTTFNPWIEFAPTITFPVSAALTGASATGEVGTLTASTLSNPSGTYNFTTIIPIPKRAQLFRAPNLLLTTLAAAATALSGVQATASAGTIAPATSIAISGVQGTGQAGNVVPSTARAITGESASGTAGTLTPGTASNVTGEAATGAVSTTGVQSAVGVSGASGTGQVGSVATETTEPPFRQQSWPVPMRGRPYQIVTLSSRPSEAPSNTSALTGVVGTGAVGTQTPSITVGLSGVSASGLAGSVTPSGGDTAPVPFKQTDWPTPKKKPIPHGNRSYLFWYVIDETVPFTPVSFPQPPRKRPTLAHRTWTQNLLQSTLQPTGNTVALSGVQGTGAAGTLGVAHTQPVTGNQGAGQAGNVTPATASALSGVVGTGAVGTDTPSTTVGASGTQGTGAVGNVGTSSAGTASLTGVQATGQVGSVGITKSGSVALTGVQATGAVGTLGASGSGSASLSGVQASSGVGTATPEHLRAETGVSGTGAVGNVGTTISVALAGVSATGHAGTIGTIGGDSTAELPADVIVLVQEDVGIIDVRPDIGIIEVR